MALDKGWEISGDRGKREQLRRLLARDGQVAGYQLEIRKKDGAVIIADGTVRLVRDGSGAPTAIEGIFRDATARVRAEEQLRELSRTLEKRVAERTTELEEKNRELERMNKLFVDREFRIKELKMTIERLHRGVAEG